MRALASRISSKDKLVFKISLYLESNSVSTSSNVDSSTTKSSNLLSPLSYSN